MQNIPKHYNQAGEPNVYKLWESSGYFNPDNLEGEPFTIMMPPPNATGTLHIGHAFETSIQDILTRYHRMKGDKTLWLPGTDHAAIATNTKVEKILIKEEGKNRHDIGREAFVKKVEEFVDASRGTIQKQLRTIGASADWSREAFTFDEPRNLAVRTAFKKMYDEGLIYRGTRVINWDPKGQTSVSDDEVVHKTEKGQLYTFKYSKDFPIAIATTRPETKVGDVAVAVNPKDKRYKKFIGKEYEVEFAGTKLNIKIVADDTVDPEFGTGAVGVTPAHSITDYEIALRQNLKPVQVINEYARMIEAAGALVAGKKTKEAREIIVSWLKENGLLEKTEDIDMNIATAERSSGVIEPLPKLQWFVDVNKEFERNGKKTSLKQLMHNAVRSGGVKILPERFEKVYFNWIDNLRDWNISRQLWYGHRIPVWYKGTTIYCDIEPPKEDGWTQDEDTLDTWFSSALWTFSTLGWPKEIQDLKTFHPTSVMAPGYEILFFWVARMILMSTFLLGEVPFQVVYLHGMVRNIEGKKFSKSQGTGIDPVEVIQKYGADALRMALVVGVGPGNDSKYDEMKVKGYRNFANKIWNAARFVLQNTEDYNSPQPPLKLRETSSLTSRRGLGKKAQPKAGALLPADKKILEELDSLVKSITKQLEKFDFAHAAEDLYHYFWHTFADKIIEESKSKLADEKTRASAQLMLKTALETQLKLLHPFMPFVTETVWQLTHEDLLMIQKWP
ncbi:MAG: valine--tRNA ligase [Candidatus Doudnabacteria bacterium]|nr:valine--tRNA ligase [Candidatus Doudnabacteria bacterium]